jgi:hypothetical protein
MVQKKTTTGSVVVVISSLAAAFDVIAAATRNPADFSGLNLSDLSSVRMSYSLN